MAKQYEQTHILNKLLTLDREIRNGNYPNSRRLSRILEVSTRTVGRYINILKIDYDAPIEFDFAKNGYYYTDKNFFIQNVMLKEGELLTISAIIPLLEQYKNTPLESNFRSIIKKITDMLPDNVTVDSSLINDEIHFIANPLTTLQPGVFDTVLRATKMRRTMQLAYKTAQAVSYTSRLFNPYNLICKAGSWYVIGYSHHSNAVRIYALPRIGSCTITENSFSVPTSFRLADYIDTSFSIWHSEYRSFTAHLHVEANLKTYIMEREWHKTQRLIENPDGSVELYFQTNQLDHCARWIVQFGNAMTVIAPPELKAAVLNIAESIVEKYRQ